MNKPIAVLVEDDPDQVKVSLDILKDIGFSVHNFSSTSDVEDFLIDGPEIIDLFVLDRRLPVRVGFPPADENGDRLFEELRNTYCDAKIIVFTGYATVRHVQSSLQGSGQLPTQSASAIDRITVLEKSQSLEFKKEVERFYELLQKLEDVEISLPDAVGPLGLLDKRIIRRLAFEYRAVSISAIAMGGGLTGAPVWRCEILRPEGQVANVVVKRVKKLGQPGSLAEVLPRQTATATVRVLSGLMAGYHLNVLQLAGDSPQALMDLIYEDPAKAVEIVKPVWFALQELESQKKTITICEICSPLIDWDELVRRLESYGFDAPPESRSVTAQIALRHGDLHPFNVLIDNGNAVLIDFDSASFAAGMLDPLTLCLSTLVHPNSPIRGGKWPSPDEIMSQFASGKFGANHRCAPWFSGVYEWMDSCQTSSRELWALTLAYGCRQLGYSDVTGDRQVLDRVLALVKRALDELGNS